jgi:hypothetical protein
MKLIGSKYKTVEGARKRAAFENSMALGEFQRGDKAYLYRYATIFDGTHYRVSRDRVVDSKPSARDLNGYRAARGWRRDTV